MASSRDARASLLIFAYGNPSRGDDALGPEFLQRLEADRQAGRMDAGFDSITDFQLQIEHSLDLEGRDLVLFVDASVSVQEPFGFSRVLAARDDSYTSHAMTPAAVLAVHREVGNTPTPAAFLLSMPGYEFDLGSAIGETAQSNLQEALKFARKLLAEPTAQAWQALC